MFAFVWLNTLWYPQVLLTARHHRFSYWIGTTSVNAINIKNTNIRRIPFRCLLSCQKQLRILNVAQKIPTRPVNSYYRDFSKAECKKRRRQITDNATNKWYDWLNDERNRAARTARTLGQFFTWCAERWLKMFRFEVLTTYDAAVLRLYLNNKNAPIRERIFRVLFTTWPTWNICDTLNLLKSYILKWCFLRNNRRSFLISLLISVVTTEKRQAYTSFFLRRKVLIVRTRRRNPSGFYRSTKLYKISSAA